MTVLTSDSHPIYVDWIHRYVGITLAPGKHAGSKYESGSWERDLAMDLDRLRDVERVDLLVCLLEDEEMEWLCIPDLVAEAEKRGIEVARLPIPDGGVLPDAAPVRRLVERIDAAVAEERRVVIHCQGGLGRAGTVAGCWLVAQGHSGDDAIACVRRARGPNAPETEAQKRFIREFEPRPAGA